MSETIKPHFAVNKTKLTLKVGNYHLRIIQFVTP